MTTSGPIDTPDDDQDTYHIVCHDCPTEFLTVGQAAAERRLSDHRASTGHNVEFAALGVLGVENE